MLLNADAKQLEWICATYLSQDKVAIDEINNQVDQHADNQERFGLPSRLIAKTFVFRLIYGGSAFSYANDPNFKDIGNENILAKSY
jgi:DNA polymerase I-like protein with 3'-5' exonuclease and polymerase domains